MKTLPTFAALLALAAAPAFAQDVTTLDTDGDLMVSWTELQAAYPDMTEDDFTAVDTSGDGMLDEAELAAAVEAGSIAPME